MLRCALTSLPILTVEQAIKFGVPELGHVDVLFVDDTRLVNLPVNGDSSFGAIDCQDDFECDSARVVISAFSLPHLSFYDLRLNEDFDGDLEAEALRQAVGQMRVRHASVMYRSAQPAM